MQIVLQVATGVAQSATDDPTTNCGDVNVRRLGGVCGQSSGSRVPNCMLSRIGLNEANHERPRPMRTNHQRLFDVGRLRRARNKCPEARRAER